MPAPKDNQFWLARPVHGRKKKYSPKKLGECALEYFQWVEDNPFQEAKPFKVKDDEDNDVIVLEDVPKMRPMTLKGLRIFLGIVPQTWVNYKANDDFMEVISNIDEVISDQKFGGAASGFFNANIIARDLGLKDVSETQSKISVTDLSEEELNARLLELTQLHEQSKED